MTPRQSFGLWFMGKRVGKKLKQDDLAKRIGITESTISCIEKGTRLPGKKHLLQIAEVFGCSIEEIVMRKMMAVTGGSLQAEDFLTRYHKKNDDIQAFMREVTQSVRVLSEKEAEDLYKTIQELLNVWESSVAYKLRFGVK